LQSSLALYSLRVSRQPSITITALASFTTSSTTQ